MNRSSALLLLLCACFTTLAGCRVEVSSDSDEEASPNSVDLGLEEGITASKVLSGLNNPAGVSFSPDGRLTVCSAGPGLDHGNGRVITWKDGESSDYVTDFATEFWKPGKDGAPNRFKLGPLHAIWLDNERLLVSNGGLADSKDNLLLFAKGGKASDGKASNGVPPTSEDPLDKGEGNFVGLSARNDNEVYVCGQGADAKSWLLSYDVSANKLSGFASADDNGIAINSPMVATCWDDDTVYVLYSGAGGKADGTVVLWDAKTKKPKARWTLPGIIDPMGMANIPGTKDFVVVDNNWGLEKVNPGRLARITLGDGGGAATVTMIGAKLMGPTSCAFGPDGKLYVSLLGPEFDANKGSVVAINGIN